MRRRGTERPIVLLEPLVAVLIWGGMFSTTKLALVEFPPLVFTVARMTLGLTMMAILSVRAFAP